MFVGEAIVNLGRFGASVNTSITEAVGFITSLPTQAATALGDLGNTLFASGQALIQGFIEGITSSLGGVGDAVGGAMEFVASYFPHSPADRGVFAGSGWSDVAASGAATFDQYLSGFNRASLAPQLATPSVAISQPGVRANGLLQPTVASASKAPITVTVHGAPGQSAETLGRVVTDGLNFMQRVAG
jgi:Tfp pilus assembly protein PilW